MTCTEAILSLLLFTPCDGSGGPSMDLAIAEALASPDRLEGDRLKDPLRRPDQVLSFFDIKPGMKVLDLFSGGGYYTEILSGVVGKNGSVTAHNNPAYVSYAAEELSTRFAKDNLGNVTQITADAAELDLPAASFDAALAILTWHDFYYVDPENGWPAIDEASLTEKLCAALKPGAVLGVIDHVAVAGSETHEAAQNLHRIDPERIKTDLSDSCFEYEGESNILRNHGDDYSKPMFDAAVRGKTDRVVYKFRHK
jgi:predicted methyltransferase